MRLPRIAATAAAVLSLLGLTGVPASATTPDYYVALGDSLSVGYQPGLGDTDQGYTDDLYTALKVRDPALELVKLGCSGETTTTMLKGGICTYPAGSQLAAAEAFLKAHRGQVRYLTLDIGANDVDGCLTGASINIQCILTGLGTVTSNLGTIASGLRDAAGGEPRLAGMNYYDPFLAAWLTGSSGHTLAEESVVLSDAFNALEQLVYAGHGFRTADVAKTFATNDFVDQATLPGVAGTVPLNVARICTWTYMCGQDNIHANPTGYQRIAETFPAVLG